MRGKLLAVLGVLAMTLAFGVGSARADQINLGDNTCTGGPWTITSTPTVTGNAFNCVDDASFSATPTTNNIHGLSYSITPNAGGATAAIDVFCSGAVGSNCTGDSLMGTLTWTAQSGLLPGKIDTLVGTVQFSSVSGFYGEYGTAGTYGFDLTVQYCSAVTGGISCTDPSSGQIPVVPEPASMLLFGSGLATIAGSLRRRKRA